VRRLKEGGSDLARTVSSQRKPLRDKSVVRGGMSLNVARCKNSGWSGELSDQSRQRFDPKDEGESSAATDVVVDVPCGK
jgi:hypothetical protein